MASLQWHWQLPELVFCWLQAKAVPSPTARLAASSGASLGAIHVVCECAACHAAGNAAMPLPKWASHVGADLALLDWRSPALLVAEGDAAVRALLNLRSTQALDGPTCPDLRAPVPTLPLAYAPPTQANIS
jgi:hypothetical protein